MSMNSEPSGISESGTPNIPETSSISNNSVEIKKLDTQATNKVISLINSESNFKEETNDSHLNRLQNLRHELNYINDTDWMYECLDKKSQL